MKFKVGDTVRVVKALISFDEKYVGKEGKVTETGLMHGERACRIADVGVFMYEKQLVRVYKDEV